MDEKDDAFSEEEAVNVFLREYDKLQRESILRMELIWKDIEASLERIDQKLEKLQKFDCS